ncbi:ras GTPase-activating-like protein IQGAP1 [Lingula anatina]|uniref:Ras GTPase-activating-like protein IQGAP1 n=1 Tax=Lingula anatina TaxID=7574 RepID=A0A1S3JM65_LINAN|nr:ras GTPase-activating-like protein IQGAP1 [Lingula anatina]|eukprot:XP_013411467.1 ras GTPase-activating-like protein IQGAP1 [Lingula anatina]
MEDQVDWGQHRASYGNVEEGHERISAEEMDEKRQENIAYEYLCHLEEAKVWIEACINDQLPATTEVEEGLRNGVYLAKLAHFMKPDLVPLKKIYDKDQERYKVRGLHFRHTDNINHWLRALEELGLPNIFYPETTDIYDRKNMPRVIYCIHALSLYMFKLGLAPQIQDLYGKIKFTEEEISAMRKELEKYGIQMPAFSKIGGILANEMPVDEAALHAAVIAINEAIDHQVVKGTLSALQNPAAHLTAVIPQHIEDYQEILHAAKHTKAENARNRSLDPDYEADVYDELLTQAEIQGNLNKVNTIRTLDRLNDALNKQDMDALMKLLQSPLLNLRDVSPDKKEFYMARLINDRETKMNNNNGEEVILDKDEVQNAIYEANKEADSEYQKMVAVQGINSALSGEDPQALMKALANPAAMLPPVHDFAANLYFEEFVNIKEEKQGDLDYEEIFGGVRVLSSIAKINQAVESGDPPLTFTALMDKNAHIQFLDENNQTKYQENLKEAKREKADAPNELLTHFEIQECVDNVNSQVQEEHERIIAVGLINDAIERGDAEGTLQALLAPSAQLKGVEAPQALHYQNLLAKEKKQKAKEMDDDGAQLWYEDIQTTVSKANRNAEEGQKMSVGVAAINIAIEDGDPKNLMNTLNNPDVTLHSLTAECDEGYLSKMQEAKNNKAGSGDTGSGWMMNRLKDGSKFYFNTDTLQYAWERPEGVVKDHLLLTREEIQNIVTEVTAGHNRELLFAANEPFIVKIQAQIRGYLVRKQYNDRLDFMKTQLPAITKIQAWYRGNKQKQKYQTRLAELKEGEPAAVKIQAAVRMHQARKKYQKQKDYYKKNEPKIVQIQAAWRSSMARQDYNKLMHSENPPVGVVRKFVHLLDQSDIDYSEEIELQNLRQQVVTAIRSNQQLEQDLDQMDIKIGLLVKNRITLQDVISHDRKLKDYKENPAGAVSKGLKSLSKESRERLEAYQHLFYLLQTNPTYLAKLIFEMPQSRTTKFMESVILTLYNYASNQREEYLLLKLFKTALEEEIRRGSSKVDKMSDIATGNPLVVKMIVSFNRNARGYCSSLRELLNPLVTKVIEDRKLAINTNPTEVYKAWVNQMETETGETRWLLLEHQDAIAPDHNDPIHELLEDLGENPDMDALLGKKAPGEGETDSANKAQLAKQTILLTLSNKFEVPDTDQTDTKNLLIRTKRMIVDVIRCQPGETLTKILNTPATEEQEEEHAALIRKRDKVDERATAKDAGLLRQKSIMDDTRIPLEAMKAKIKKNLHNLVLANVVSHKDHYQAIINMIVQDIRNQRIYRQRRKQEMMRIKETLKALNTKRAFFEEQIDYYNKYVTTCLDNLNKKGK